ncbi:winged helix-turn-helix transcriptional regulator [Halobium salinum]|uniref:Winged helix-turn-helix transcriptional regulator n=1 Tax=Halobium salinum TaxID=1364940 RepID=A0ABD5PB20_9EURY|nr:helix-turn-helix domain-containing protein [Halobium salinum]
MGKRSDTAERWCAGEDWCPITAAADIVGKKWRPVIIHRLLNEGPLGFSALQTEISGISSKVLSENLAEMEELGVVTRRVISDKPFRVEYSLTEQGEALRPTVESLAAWSIEYLLPPEAEEEYERREEREPVVRSG